MNNLVIDIGNTFSKIALFNNRDLEKLHITEAISIRVLEEVISEFDIDNAIVSSVGREIPEIESFLQSFSNYHRFKSSGFYQVINHYKTPATLGPDRYAAVIGASSLFKDQDCMVIDAGTCVTYDFIDRNRNYFGGSITPGLSMRFKAMHSFTGKLPMAEFNEEFNDKYGADTWSALLSGVQNGIVYEAEGFIQSYINNYPGMIVVISGGDVNFFDTRLKNSIFAPIIKSVPNLVLIGLNEVIHQYND